MSTIEISIYITDSSINEKNKSILEEIEKKIDLGFKVDKDKELLKDKYQVVKMIIRRDSIIGYWVDPDKDELSNETKDIIVYAGGTSFRCPYSSWLINILYDILEDNERL
jgi:hypothetical protein